MPDTPESSDHPSQEPQPGEMPPDPFGEGDPFDVGNAFDGNAFDGNAFDPTAGSTPSAGGPGAPTTGSGSTTSPGGDPFAGLGTVLGPMMGDLMRALSDQQQHGWQQAKHYATIRAAGYDAGVSGPGGVQGAGHVGGQPSTAALADAPVDPLDRIRLEELVSIVERRVAATTGLDTASAKGLKVAALTRVGWATAFLDAHRAVLEPVLATSTGPAASAPNVGDPSSPEAMFAGLLGVVGPSMMALQLGAMAGQLAHRYFGSGDLPLPRADSDTVWFVPSNLTRFASDWSLPLDSLRVRVAIDELVMHSVMRIPAVATLLRTHIAAHASGFRVDTQAMIERMSDFSGDPSAMQEQFADLGAFASPTQLGPEQRRAAATLQRIGAVVSGYTSHVGDRVGEQLLGGDRRIAEALRRRRLEPDDATEMLARLTGLHLTAEHHERGGAFVAGVLDRTGDDGAVPLGRLWSDEASLPTDAELDAPGLWLARIDLQP